MNPGYTWVRMGTRFFQTLPFPAWIAHASFEAEGPADLRPFSYSSKGLGKRTERSSADKLERIFYSSGRRKNLTKYFFCCYLVKEGLSSFIRRIHSLSFDN
jgi:hypothetical protein